jgi:hypothetical protein
MSFRLDALALPAERVPNPAEALTQLAPAVEAQIQLRNLAKPRVIGAQARGRRCPGMA